MLINQHSFSLFSTYVEVILYQTRDYITSFLFSTYVEVILLLLLMMKICLSFLHIRGGNPHTYSDKGLSTIFSTHVEVCSRSSIWSVIFIPEFKNGKSYNATTMITNSSELKTVLFEEYSDFDDEDDKIKIHYCPICGRQLN